MFKRYAIVAANDILGENEIWFVDLPEEIFEPYINTGCSVVGSDEYLIEELGNYLKNKEAV